MRRRSVEVRFGWNHMVQPITHNQVEMETRWQHPYRVVWEPYHVVMVQPIAAALLEMTNKDGGALMATRLLPFLQTLKEYEIITLIITVNRKSCSLNLLSYCAPEDTILYSIRPGSMMFEAKLVGAKANW